MTKKVIAIISVLKPVDDTRNFEKVARSINNTSKYEINIIGFSTKKVPADPNINFHPIFNFSRTSFGRLIAPLKIFQILIKLKPELIIVTCAEILIVISLYKIIFGGKIIYDIQENYYRNIIYSGAYPRVIKYPMAWLARSIELIGSVAVDKFFVAEGIYKKQLRFLPTSTQIIENKAVIPEGYNTTHFKKQKKIALVYSGTIAAHYGIFDAVDFVVKLNANSITTSLKIIGYAPQQEVLQKLRLKISKYDYITLIGGEALIPHNQILKEITQADFCLLPYQSNKSTEGRIPTKLFECLALEKPVIISPNKTLSPIIKQNNAGIIYDFQSREEFPIHCLRQKFYGNHMKDHYLWMGNAELIKKQIEKLLA